MESDDHTAASGKVSESGQSTVVTSEGRQNATQRSDLGGRRAAEMTIEDKSGNKHTTRSYGGSVREPNTTRFDLAPTDENRHGNRQGSTSSPAETTYFVRERAEREHRSDHMANCQRVSTCPEEAKQEWLTNRGGCASMHAQKPHSRGHPS